MYTECPECHTAFRVTPEVLQAAAGRVRCGGCGHAFSAIDHLTEGKPPRQERAETPPPAVEAETDDEFAETSRQLLETLDELAGPGDVRIEDTGVEWRVLDDDDEESAEETAEVPALDELSLLAAAALDSEDPQPVPPEERRYDDNTPLPDDFDDEEEYVYVPPQPQRRATDAEAHVIEDEAQSDLALSEPDEWTDLLEEVDEADVIAASADEAGLPDIEEEVETIEPDADPAEVAEHDSSPSDLHKQFEMQAEELGISGSYKLDEDETDEVPLVDVELAEEDSTVEASAEVEQIADEEREPTVEFEAQIEEAARALEGEDDKAVDQEPDVASEPAESELTLAAEEETQPDDEDEQTADEEETKEPSVEERIPAVMAGLSDPSVLFNEDSEEVETIVMEGESISSDMERERLQAEAKARFENAGSLIDTYAANRGKVRGGRRFTDPPGYGVIAVAAILTLLLAAQVIHARRETLATYGFFEHTIAPVYRMLGQPVTPAWDVTGWQFEATNGSIDEDEALLTIVSRIGNRSGQALPYPLVHVSLTDRYEEIIGSRVLEPNEYLAGDLDPRVAVPPGENFTAVLTIQSPSADATGFKLNVCYRAAPDQVRCATEDFKD